MKQKQTIKLNESQLRGLIKESIKKVLNENIKKWSKENGYNEYLPKYSISGGFASSMTDDGKFYQGCEIGLGATYSLGEALEKARNLARYAAKEYRTSPCIIRVYDEYKTDVNSRMEKVIYTICSGSEESLRRYGCECYELLEKEIDDYIG